MPEKSLTRAIVVALVAHALIAAAALGHTQRAPPSGVSDVEVTLEVADTPAKAAEEEERLAAATPRTAALGAAAPREIRSARAGSAAATAALEGAPVGGAGAGEGAGGDRGGGAAPGASSSTGIVSFGAPAASLAIDAPSPLFVGTARDAEPTVADANERVQASMRAAQQAHDSAIGLGPEGPVLSALGDAAGAGTTPTTGRAVFFAITNREGLVVSIDVLECDGSRSAWNDAAKAALKDLAGKRIPMRGAKRAEMQIEVTSAWKLPNGQDPGLQVSVLGQTVKKGEGASSTRLDLLDGQSLISGNPDPSNINAAPRRIVHTRMLASRVL